MSETTVPARNAGLAMRLAACRIADELAALLETCEAEHFRHAAAFCRSAAADVRSATAPVHAGGATPLTRLASVLDLTPSEVDLLLIAGLADEHDGFAGAFELLHPLREPYPTAGLLSQVRNPGAGSDEALVLALATGRLVRDGLLHVVGDAPLFRRSLRLANGLWFALNGLPVWPDGVTQRLEAANSAGLEAWLEQPESRLACAALREGTNCTVVVHSASPDVAVNRALAMLHIAARRDHAVLDAPQASSVRPSVMSAFAVAHDVIPVLRVGLRAQGADRTPVLIDSHPGPVVVCGRPGDFEVPDDRRVLTVGTNPVSAQARARMWRELLPGMRDASETLARHHALEPNQALRISADVGLRSELGDRKPEVSDVVASVRGRIEIALPAGVEIRPPRVQLGDVVAPDRTRSQLQEVVYRVENPQARRSLGVRERPGGHGVRLLLAGPPGTGKTFTAEALAGELGTDLLQIDISRVVSKWIGETEKNLAEAFDAAERAKAVLFFDEADALLGERTEIADANDRYANMETAYLLTRIERCEGLVVLATNLIGNLDDAFLRRMEFVVHLAEPDPALRRQLWERELGLDEPEPGSDAPSHRIDFERLAMRYDTSGALIRNAAEAATFLAARCGRRVEMADIETCMRREYLKVGRAFPAAPRARRNPWDA